MNTIYIRNLTVETIIGCYPHERLNKQPVIINLEVAADFSQAALTDELANTLDYATLANRLTQFIEQRQDKLLETLADACAHMLMQEFKPHWLRLQIGKPQALQNAEQVGVIVERSRV
jgi:dihydroneopterin aldolase